MAGGGGGSSRLFIAAVPPPSVRAALVAMQDALRAGPAARPTPARELRWVRPEAMHLTLRFLGGTPGERAPAIGRALAATAAASPPIDLRLGALGTFGGHRPRVVWVGLEGDLAALAACAAMLNRAPGRGGLPRRPTSAAGRTSPWRGCRGGPAATRTPACGRSSRRRRRRHPSRPRPTSASRRWN